MNYRMTGALALLLFAAPGAAQKVSKKPDSVIKGQTVRLMPREERVMADPVNVRLTFYLIQGDGFQNDDAEIRPLVVELRKVFRFTGYRLASKSVLQAGMGHGGAEVQQVVNDPDGLSYMIIAGMDPPTPDGHIYMHVRLYPGSFQGATKLIDASVNLSDGKTAILGSALGGKGTAAIILAVSPTIEK